MLRALTILATVAALAVSAAPASAASGTGAGRVGGKMHLEDISLGIITDKATPKLREAAVKGRTY